MAYNSFLFLNSYYDFFSAVLLIIFSIICNLVVDFNIKNKSIKIIIKLGVMLRIFIIVVDNYYKIISFSSADGIVFHENGYLGLNNLSYWEIPIIKSVIVPSYKFLGEPVPIFIALINLLAYTLAIVYLYKSMNLISSLGIKRKKLIMILLNFSLVSALLNVSLLREGIMLFFTTLSIYFYMKRNTIYKIFSILLLSVSFYFHSGMIFILFGYLYSFVMRQKGKKKLIYVLIGGFLLILSISLISKLQYFKGRSLEKIITLEATTSGSNYVIKSNSIQQYILYSPMRLFYFLFAPTPNMFRGAKDIFSFLLNSLIYVYLIYDSIKNYKMIRDKISNSDKILIQSLYISFFITSFIYALGTNTAGTALRHRDKLLFLLALINFYIYSRNIVDSKKIEEEE